MRTSTEIDKIATAALAIQTACPFVDKTASALIQGQSSGYDYKYAPHDMVWGVIHSHCAANGVFVSQGGDRGEANSKWLVTRIVHAASGQWIETDVPLETAKAGMQALGAVWSYARRIGLLGIFGIVAKGEDSDAGDDHGPGRGAKPPRIEPSARPVGVNDAVATVERVLQDLPRLNTLADIDEASKIVKHIVPDGMKDRVRAAFMDARARVKGGSR